MTVYSFIPYCLSIVAKRVAKGFLVFIVFIKQIIKDYTGDIKWFFIYLCT